MVIEPREGRVLRGLNANELMDVQEETFQLNSIMYVGKMNYYRNLIILLYCIYRSDPIERSYFNFLKQGLASL